MNRSASTWPSTAAARDRWVVDLRGPRPARDPARHRNLIIEDEPSAEGPIARVATVFLAGRECPWRCAMCDLWTHTTPGDTEPGAIPAQLASARLAISAAAPPVTQIKLYNAGSFFDPRAVPESDYDRVAALLDGFERVVVESHPALIGSRADRFLDALGRRVPGPSPPIALEVAVGLETAHPAALERLNKRMTTADVASAADWLHARGVDLRVFLLISPPFIAPKDQDEWLLRSTDMALSCGATAISLIPTRGGNGAMEAVAAEGLFHPPGLADVERSYDAALRRAGARARVFVDLWDIDRLLDCPRCGGERRARLHRMNLGQRVLPPVICDSCGAPAGR